MHIHILGICGKFMSGIAIIAKQKGFTVTGSDKNLLEPIAGMLRRFDIGLSQGYDSNSLPDNVDCVVIGNALSRGVPIIERILNDNIAYISGPQWLYQHVLKDKWVIAVAGTHGKTTTTSLVTWILEQAGYNPGFLIGGNPANFSESARYTDSNFFIIEADEYDTAFFDKRPKFMHYHPRTAIINNLEFDHADIFTDLNDIKRQFLNFLRIIPGDGLIITPQSDANVQSLFAASSWTRRENFDHAQATWYAKPLQPDCSEFEIFHDQKSVGVLTWRLLGQHNMNNALAACAAARHVGVTPQQTIAALSTFQGVKRRLELRGVVRDIAVYDDFAHHPTAIALTLTGLRQHVAAQRIFAVLEFGSNTMRSQHHQTNFPHSFKEANHVILLKPKECELNFEQLLQSFSQPVNLFDNVNEIVTYLSGQCRAGDHIVCMSNLGFDNIHEKLLLELASH
jgi:UDP-N-acetylmuramate: L-alanyl-gamma-D-glutamyl-meso-diaminopimelate ligase